MAKRILCSAVAMMYLVAVPTLADCGKCGNDKPACNVQAKSGDCCAQGKTVAAKSKTCSADGKSCCPSNKSACSGEAKYADEMARMKGLALPQMTYQVKDQRLSCPKSAAALAQSESATIKYVVADKVYEDKGAALAAHAEVLDKFLGEMLTVKFAVGDACVGCPNAAQAMAKAKGTEVGYRVASFNFADRETAAKAAKMARAAADKVEMTAMVGDQAYHCPVEAGEVAKKHGKGVDYCVGKTKTACKATARLALAKARIEAALAACEQCGGKQIVAGA